MKKQKLVICASASFEDEIVDWKNKLESNGFDVIKYPTKIHDDLVNKYNKEFSEHYKAVTQTDILLALNLNKKGIPGYIGAGLFAEMAFGIGLNQAKKNNIEVYYINSFPKDGLPYSDELNLWQGLGWIKQFHWNNENNGISHHIHTQVKRWLTPLSN
jgi:hypothetical protein